jgi:sulfate-transporting ATPase
MEVVRFAVLGLGSGGLYALVALGLVLVHQGTGIVNLAHGSVAVIGGLLWVSMCDAGVPQVLAAGLAVAACAALGVAIQVLVMRPMRAHPALLRLMATLGISSALVIAADHVWGGQARLVDSMLPNDGVTLFGDVRIGMDRLILAGIAGAVAVGIAVWTSSTRTGLAVRASGHDPDAVTLTGWSALRIGTTTWAAGCALAGLAGVLLAPITGLEITTSSLILVPALAAALVGGLRSPGLTLAGALAIGAGESLVSRYSTTPGLASALPLVVVVVLLAVRGNAIPDRAEASPRLPSVTPGHVRPVAIAAVVIAAVLMLRAPSTLADAVTVSAVAAVLCCSIVVVTGFAGQLSLAPLVLAGVGALGASRALQAGWPFLLAVGAGAAVAVPAGLIVALPAMRSRGTSLAVATLALGVTFQRMVFGNTDITGGMTGVTYDPPNLFGVPIDAVAHPGRYAAVAVALAGSVAVAVTALRRTATGRRMLALRSNERAALATGVAVKRSKLLAFALSAAIAGIGGALDGLSGTSATFSGYTALGSAAFLSVAVIGGVGFATGSVFGGVIAAGGVFALGLARFGEPVEDLLPFASALLMVQGLIRNPNGLLGRRDAAPPTERPSAPSRSRWHEMTPPFTAHGRHGDPALQVRDLTVRYGGITAVRDVSLAVWPGEVVGIIGPNGAGKSSLVDAICGFTPATGAVQIGGRRVDRLGPHVRVRTGLVRTFQSMELFDDLTVRENLAVALANGAAGRTGPLRIEELAADLGLEVDLDLPPDRLPMGRRRLVAVTRALASEPRVLLLDEPAVGMHGDGRHELARLVRSLADERGVAVVLVEHDTDLVFAICDRIVVLEGGAVLAEGAPADVRADPQVVAAYLGSMGASR